MKEIPYLSPKTHQTLFEIDLNAFKHNLKYYKSLVNPSTKIIVMVKAFAYGLGLSKISEVLSGENVDYLAVAYTDEAVELRKAGYQKPLLVFNPEPHCFDNIIRYHIEPEIYSLDILQAFIDTINNNAAYQMAAPFPIHIKLDTGMHRLGFMPYEVPELIEKVKASGKLNIKSVFTHLVAAEMPEHDHFTREQINLFLHLFDEIEHSFSYPILKHVLNSAGIERFPQYQMDLVRLGIGLYGFTTNAQTEKKLKPVCHLYSRIAQIKTVKQGDTVGYGRSFVAPSDRQIAIVFLGYADGLPRSLSNKGELYVNGKMAPIVGNVCMDITMIDVTGITCKVGDMVEVFGPNFKLKQFADMIGTIPYEVLTDISSRVRRIYLE